MRNQPISCDYTYTHTHLDTIQATEGRKSFYISKSHFFFHRCHSPSPKFRYLCQESVSFPWFCLATVKILNGGLVLQLSHGLKFYSANKKQHALEVWGWADPKGEVSIRLQFSSVVQSCPTQCDPMDCSTPGLPVHHQFLEFPQKRPLSWWCHPMLSAFVIPFFSHPQSVPAWWSFWMSHFFAAGSQTIGVSASASVLPVNIQDWFPLG